MRKVLILALANGVLTVILVSYNFYVFYKMKYNYLRRYYSWVDILFILQNVTLVSRLIIEYNQSYEERIETFESDQKFLRFLEVMGTLL